MVKFYPGPDNPQVITGVNEDNSVEMLFPAMISFAEKIRNLLDDLFFFIQVLIYWPLVLFLLKPLWWIDRKTKAGFFKYIDNFIRRIAG